MKRVRWFSVLAASLIILVFGRDIAAACGGFFSGASPVYQDAEQIIFTMNDDKTISVYLSIEYTGEAEDFAWVLPVPSEPTVEVADQAIFSELDNLTEPRYILPDEPSCVSALADANLNLFGAAGSEDEGAGASAVQVLSQGQAGAFDYSVISSEDPNTLVNWLRENQYQVTAAMEPYIEIYTSQGMLFVAMKITAGRDVSEIQPVKLTMEAEQPMIPIQLAAVAANPETSIIVWIFGDAPAYAVNYANLQIDDEDIRAESQFTTNYLELADQIIDDHAGHAFIIEYAQPINNLLSRPTSGTPLDELTTGHQFVTRLATRMSPEDMTLDPVFDFDSDLPPIHSYHNLKVLSAREIYGCTQVKPPALLGGYYGLLAAFLMFGVVFAKTTITGLGPNFHPFRLASLVALVFIGIIVHAIAVSGAGVLPFDLVLLLILTGLVWLAIYFFRRRRVNPV